MTLWEFLGTQQAACIAAVELCVTALVFTIIFYIDGKRRRTVRQTREKYKAIIAEKDKEIARLKDEKLSIGAERFEAAYENKLLKVQLENAIHANRQYAKAGADK